MKDNMTGGTKASYLKKKKKDKNVMRKRVAVFLIYMEKENKG